jgi:hypothetical protein
LHNWCNHDEATNDEFRRCSGLRGCVYAARLDFGIVNRIAATIAPITK